MTTRPTSGFLQKKMSFIISHFFLIGFLLHTKFDYRGDTSWL